MKYTELSEHDGFKANDRERVWRYFGKVIHLPDDERLGDGRGKLLVCFTHRGKCRQMVVEPNAEPFATLIMPF